MPCAYILRSSKDSKLYVGSTRTTAVARLAVHNSGSVRSTKSRRPFNLLHQEKFDTYREAKKKELFFKTSSGRRVVKNILYRKNGQMPE